MSQRIEKLADFGEAAAPIERRNIKSHLQERLQRAKETQRRTERALELLEKHPEVQELIDLLGQINY